MNPTARPDRRRAIARRRRAVAPWAAAALLALGSGLAAADDEPIATDRPDFVESSDVVGAGRFQLETGVSFDRTRADGLRVRGRATPTLLRFGSSENTELRLETDAFTRVRVRDRATDTRDTSDGFADVSLGLKWHLQDGDEAGTPGLAVLAHVDLATGSRSLRGRGARPSLRGVAEWSLPGDWSVGTMAGVAMDNRDDGHRFATGILAVTTGKSWTPAWRSFLEVAGQSLASRRNGGRVVTLDAGVTYLVSADVQLDLSASRGLTRSAPDLQWGAGLSLRF